MSRTLTDQEEKIISEVNQEKLMEYNHEIAKFIRNSGTEEELLSFQYIDQELKKAGIPTEMTFSDGYISLPISSKLVVNGVEYKSITHSMSTSVEGLEAELEYVGKGKPADYYGKDTKNKIVVVEGLCMPIPVKTAEDHGAVGIIFLNDEHIHNMIGSCIWGSPSIEDCKLLPKIAFLSVDSFSAAKIKTVLQQGNAKAIMTTVVDTRWRTLPTLVGTITSSEVSNKYLMLSNHVDGWIYGAMDNGSANAALMHVVEILNKHKELLKRTIKICFWSGHSHGRYAGSSWYCDTHYEDIYENCFLHVNADSLGAKGSDILTEANCMPETKTLAYEIIKTITGQEYNGCRYSRAGDQSFWGTGTPSLFMGLSEQPIGEGTAAKSFAELMGNGKTGGFGWWWHSEEDTIDKIDPEKLARDCKIYLLAVYRAVSDVFLPIEQNKAAMDILRMLKAYQEKIGNKCSLQETIDRAVLLCQLTQTIEENKQNIGSAVFNQYVMDMSKILVPLSYVEGDVFEHDIAVRGNELPILTILDKYDQVEINTDAWKLVNVASRRKINKVNFLLGRAIDLAKSVIKN